MQLQGRVCTGRVQGGIDSGGFSWLGGLSQLSPLDMCASLVNNALRSIPESSCKSAGRWLRPPTCVTSPAILSFARVPGSSEPVIPPDAPSGESSARWLPRPHEHQAGRPPGLRSSSSRLRLAVSSGLSAGNVPP